jgi:TPR repeat protein
LAAALIQDTQASIHAGNALMQRRDERMQKLVREAAAEIENTKRMIEHLEKRLAGEKREDDVRQTLGQEAAEVHKLEEVEQYCLPALKCRYGQEVHQSYAQTRGWFEKAAAQGDTYAQDNFDSLCHSDQGVSQGNAKARKWFEKAASQGHLEVQNGIKELQEIEEQRRAKRKRDQQEAAEARRAGEPEKQRRKASQKAKERSRAFTKRKASEDLTDLALKQAKTAVVKQRTKLEKAKKQENSRREQLPRMI